MVDPSLQKTNIGEQRRGQAGDVKGTGAPSRYLKHKQTIGQLQRLG